MVFNDAEQKWYIIEINPRFSGMTKTVATAYSFNPLLAILEPTKVFKNLNDDKNNQKKYALSIKFPLLEEEMLEKLANFPNVQSVSQTSNDLAKQNRERGFCEIIIAAKTTEELKNRLEEIKISFPSQIEKAFFDTAEKLLDDNTH